MIKSKFIGQLHLTAPAAQTALRKTTTTSSLGKQHSPCIEISISFPFGFAISEFAS
jgi:hypothetical protein